MKQLIGRGYKKVSDEIIIKSYKRLGSVQKVGKEIGLSHATVHERLIRLKIDRNNKPFSKEEIQILEKEYQIYRDAGKLRELAKELNRTTSFICKRARYLGLTDKKHKKLYSGKWKYMSFGAAGILFNKFKKSNLGLGQFCKRYGFEHSGFYNTMKHFFPDEWDYVIELKAPKQSLYRLGRHFEYRVRDDMRKKDYFVLRSPRSGSPVDLICIKKGKIIFIQCKRGGIFSVTEWNIFYKLCKSVHALPILASTPEGSGIKYHLLLGLKGGTKKLQPYKLTEIL